MILHRDNNQTGIIGARDISGITIIEKKMLAIDFQPQPQVSMEKTINEGFD